MKSLPLVRYNIVANFSGKAWIAFLSLAFVPLYIKLMGVEVYGLLGVFMSVGALLSLLDMGLSATLSRELSRLSCVDDSRQETCNLIRTFELVFWCVGALIGCVVLLLAPFIARYWINSGEVGVETVEYALMIMGVSIALQWPSGIYSGGLMGLQRQITHNLVKTIVMTVQHLGAVGVLLWVSPSILTFFAWHTLMSLVSTLALRWWLWRSIPIVQESERLIRPEFSLALLIKNWRFASGVSGIALTTLLLTQVDKIILSKMLTLEYFGYYMLAFSVANTINNLVSPISSALQPRLTQLIAANDSVNLIALFRKGTQLLSVALFPIAITIALFSKQILILWLGDNEVSNSSYLLLTFLVIGTAINALVALPYALQLAFGYTKLVFHANIVAVMVLVPLMVLMTTVFEGLGATSTWIVLNFGYLVILAPLMYRQWGLPGLGSWYKRDILLPGLVTFLIVLFVRMFLPEHASFGAILLSLFAALTLSVIGAVMSSNQLNKNILKHWKAMGDESVKS